MSLLFAVGCIVALVQAQDSATNGLPTTYRQPGMLPANPAARPAMPTSGGNGSLSAALREATADVTTEYSGEVAQVAGTSTIKSAQYRSVRPKPTYPNRGRQAATAPAQPSASVYGQPGAVYAPVPTTPPTVEMPAAQVADRFGGRAVQPTTPTTQATLGAPYETEDHTANASNEQGAEPAVAPTPGMRSVLKRSGSDVGPVMDDATSPVVASDDPGGAELAESASDAEAELAPAGISARRSSNDLSVPSTRIDGQASESGRRTAGMEQAYSSRSIQDLSLTGRSPGLRVSVAGPQSVTVGKPVTYVVNLFNDGDTDSSQVMVKASIPSWVKVSSGETTDGDATVQSDGRGSSRLLWTVPGVAAKSHQTLRVVLTASEGRPFDFDVEWSMQAMSAKATIAVQQPQLEISLAGPADMIFGQQKVFTLTVSNPGSGDADRVVVSIASGDNRPQQIDVGAIPAGMQKEIPVQVVANHAGEMSMKATAAADGGLRAEAVGKVMVRRATVMAAIEGPQLKYAGTDATYAVVLRNTGDAPAEDLTASLTLPPGSKYLGGVEGATTSTGAIKWKVAGLPAGSERIYQMKLQLNTMGVNRLALQAHNESGVAVTAVAETSVEAVSDLKLTVNDPAGPIAVGSDATYELTLVNRGKKSASGVRVVMQFGEGVEPVAVEGAEARVVPGQIVCEPLPQLAAGEKVTFRVKAAADREGTHAFRVEVTSSDNETRLVTEGASRFFAESGRMDAAARTARQPSLLPQGSAPDVIQR